jgi:nuclear pore complex protein Nup62
LFGAGPVATATATDTKEEKKPAISFGAPAPASSASESTTTPTNASSKGGFSFGGTKLVPATPAGVATPAPVSTPVPIKTAATSAAPAAGPAPAPTKEPSALEYQTLTVEEILNKFQKQLEEDALAFCEEAKRVCEFDAVLRDSARDLGRLTNEAQRLMIEQEQVERGLEGISSLQTQLEQTLVQVEEQVDAIFQTQGHLNPLDADAERERAYEMAKGIEYRLDHVTESLRDTVLTLNQANTQTFGKASGNAIQTIGDVVTILNQHQDGLAELEAAAQKLELDCGEVHAVLATTRR